MKKRILLFLLVASAFSKSYCQSKTLIGIAPFQSTATDESNNYNRNSYNRNNSSTHNQYATQIQDAVGDVFLQTKRFSLVEREKMNQLASEKNLQKSEDFIDGQVIEQSKSLGAQYVVLGNISKAGIDQKQTTVPLAGTITTYTSQIAFSIRVVDVSTGEIMASNSFNASAKGKNSFTDALNIIKPEIEKFIKDNFKIMASVASVEEKNSKGEATQVLISKGSAAGIKEKSEFKVFEVTELTVDGKKIPRKKTIGKIVVIKVEDENFSICSVLEGGEDILKKLEAGAKVKCELTNE